MHVDTTTLMGRPLNPSGQFRRESRAVRKQDEGKCEAKEFVFQDPNTTYTLSAAINPRHIGFATPCGGRKVDVHPDLLGVETAAGDPLRLCRRGKRLNFNVSISMSVDVGE